MKRKIAKIAQNAAHVGDATSGSEDVLQLQRELAAVKEELSLAKEFIINVLKSHSPAVPISIPVRPRQLNRKEKRLAQYLDLANKKTTKKDGWTSLAPKLKRDREIALTAFVGEHCLLEDLPDPWCDDRDFFRDALSLNSKLWFRVPEAIQVDRSFLEELGPSFRFRNDDMIAAEFEKIPELCDDPFIWKNIISTFSSDRQDENKTMLLTDNVAAPSEFCSLKYAPDSILSDRELMKLACIGAPKELLNVNRELTDNDSFLREVLTEQPVGLLFVASENLSAHPDLVMNYVGAFLRSEFQSYQYHLVKRLGTVFFREDNMELAEAWFRNGGRFDGGCLDGDVFPHKWRDRGEIFLWIAEYASRSIPDRVQRHVFGRIAFLPLSDRLKGDLQFMTKVAELVDWPLFCGSESVQKNMEVIVRALSHDKEDAKVYATKLDTPEWDDWNKEIYAWVEEKYEVYANFCKLILSQMSEKCTSESPLRILAQGPETTLVYKKLIAQYAGIPMGTELQFYLRYYENKDEPFMRRYLRRC